MLQLEKLQETRGFLQKWSEISDVPLPCFCGCATCLQGAKSV